VIRVRWIGFGRSVCHCYSRFSIHSFARHSIRRALFQALLITAVVGGMLVLSTAALAAGSSPGSLAVVGAWSRATVPGVSVGVVYFEIVNAGAADSLRAIESPAAQRVEMHSMMIVDGVMQMRPTRAVYVPAKGRVLFKPRGLHAMLIDLKQPLKEGERFPLTLVFRHSGRVRVEAIIHSLGALTPPAVKDFAHEQHH
jgi:copper(I)-binding protein